MEMNFMKKAVIIGAGPAGITAAVELLKTGEYSVTLLEATDSIGGISQTVSYQGNRMDIGGHRFFSKNDKVTNWWEQLMPMQGAPSYDDKLLEREKPLAEGGPDPEQEDRVMLVRERVSRIYYNNHFFDYPISMKPQTIKNMGLLTTFKAGLSYLKACMFKLPETSLENFYINRFGKVLYSMFFEGYTEKLWGRHPSEISADWGAQRVKGLSITALLKDMAGKALHIKSRNVETSLIERFVYPKYGPGQLWETAAEKVKDMGGEILMQHEVKKIMCQGRHITSVVCDTPDGKKTIEGDIFLSTMPIKDLIAAMDGDKPCGVVQRIARKLPYRDFMTAGLLVNKLALKNNTDIPTLGDIVPDCWIYVQDKSVKMGRIQIFNNWSPYMVKDPENTVWLGLEYFCAEGDDMWNTPDRDFIEFAAKELEKIGVIQSADDVIDAHVERVKKAYPAYFDTYKHLGTVIKFLDTFDNLYCMGRNGQHRYNNMDHSMLTAFETVKAIAENKKSRKDIWNVNAEKEYHEEK